MSVFKILVFRNSKSKKVPLYEITIFREGDESLYLNSIRIVSRRQDLQEGMDMFPVGHRVESLSCLKKLLRNWCKRINVDGWTYLGSQHEINR